MNAEKYRVFDHRDASRMDRVERRANREPSAADVTGFGRRFAINRRDCGAMICMARSYFLELPPWHRHRSPAALKRQAALRDAPVNLQVPARRPVDRSVQRSSGGFTKTSMD
jgi:hypothetical protein